LSGFELLQTQLSLAFPHKELPQKGSRLGRALLKLGVEGRKPDKLVDFLDCAVAILETLLHVVLLQMSYADVRDGGFVLIDVDGLLVELNRPIVLRVVVLIIPEDLDSHAFNTVQKQLMCVNYLLPDFVVNELLEKIRVLPWMLGKI